MVAIEPQQAPYSPFGVAGDTRYWPCESCGKVAEFEWVSAGRSQRTWACRCICHRKACEMSPRVMLPLVARTVGKRRERGPRLNGRPECPACNEPLDATYGALALCSVCQQVWPVEKEGGDE